jgi:signal transduction histidine kinase
VITGARSSPRVGLAAPPDMETALSREAVPTPTVAVVSAPLPAAAASSPLGRRLTDRLGLPPIGVRTWLRGWPALAQLVLDVVLSVPYIVVAAFAVAAMATLPVVIVGLPMLYVVLKLSWLSAFVERARIWALLDVYIPRPAAHPTDQPLWRRTLFDSRYWRALAHVVVVAVWGVLVGSGVVFVAWVALALAALPAYAAFLPPGGVFLPWGSEVEGFWWYALLTVTGLAMLAVLPLLARALVVVDVLLARLLLGPAGHEEVERLEARVETLTQTRVATVDSVEVERRRIERDLHDGPQQRLVAIAMDLGMARERLGRDPEGARELLDKAHAASKEAITEMRQVARGIHPPVLTDRGLDAALSALAARSPVPVEVRVDVPARPSPTVEAIAYFCVSEALTNVAKHSRATAARVDVRSAGGLLEVHVSDNGVGGADEAGGTGLRGLTDRVRAVDGTIEVTSPPGGPTVVMVHLPLPATRPARAAAGPAAGPAAGTEPGHAATTGPTTEITTNPGSAS